MPTVSPVAVLSVRYVTLPIVVTVAEVKTTVAVYVKPLKAAIMNKTGYNLNFRKLFADIGLGVIVGKPQAISGGHLHRMYAVCCVLIGICCDLTFLNEIPQ